MTVALRAARALASAGRARTVGRIVVAEVPMRIASVLSTLAASAALVAAPVAFAQTSTEKAAQPKPAATKPAPKASADSKATKVDGASAVRTTPTDAKKSGEKSYDGCGSSKMAASDA
jgi:hypothetical protein